MAPRSLPASLSRGKECGEADDPCCENLLHVALGDILKSAMEIRVSCKKRHIPEDVWDNVNRRMDVLDDFLGTEAHGSNRGVALDTLQMLHNDMMDYNEAGGIRVPVQVLQRVEDALGVW